MHKNVKLARRLPNYCNVSSWRNNLIKLTHYDETEKMAHDSQIVRAKGNFKLSNGGPSYRKDTIWESDKNTRKHHTQESQEVGPFPAGDRANGCKEQIIQYNKDKRET